MTSTSVLVCVTSESQLSLVFCFLNIAALQFGESIWLHGAHISGRENEFLREESGRIPEDGSRKQFSWCGPPQILAGRRFLDGDLIIYSVGRSDSWTSWQCLILENNLTTWVKSVRVWNAGFYFALKFSETPPQNFWTSCHLLTILLVFTRCVFCVKVLQDKCTF